MTRVYQLVLKRMTFLPSNTPANSIIETFLNGKGKEYAFIDDGYDYNSFAPLRPAPFGFPSSLIQWMSRAYASLTISVLHQSRLSIVRPYKEQAAPRLPLAFQTPVSISSF